MKKKGDPIDGVLLFDKPEGLSSNAAMQIVPPEEGQFVGFLVLKYSPEE